MKALTSRLREGSMTRDLGFVISLKVIFCDFLRRFCQISLTGENKIEKRFKKKIGSHDYLDMRDSDSTLNSGSLDTIHDFHGF